MGVKTTSKGIVVAEKPSEEINAGDIFADENGVVLMGTDEGSAVVIHSPIGRFTVGTLFHYDSYGELTDEGFVRQTEGASVTITVAK